MPLRRLFILAFFLLGHASSLAQSTTSTDAQTHRFLFVGNSYTYFHSMPQLFKAIVEAKMPGHEVEAKFIGGGGATLEKHWDVEIALQEIQSGAWDYVVLQGQSMLGSDDLTDPDSPNQFYKYARMFDKEIKASGAETVFYMTWSRRDQKELQKFLTHAYQTIGEELGSTVVPVGLVWDNARDYADIDLYIEDGSHPSVAGSYLAAVTFAATLFDIEPENIPGELNGREILRGGALADEETRLSDVPSDQVQTIMGAVSNVMQEVGN